MDFVGAPFGFPIVEALHVSPADMLIAKGPKLPLSQIIEAPRPQMLNQLFCHPLKLTNKLMLGFKVVRTHPSWTSSLV